MELDARKARFEMNFYKQRLQSFTDWPFDANCSCTPEKMAEAGFFHCPTENEPDLVKCFVCLKELDGWEPDDDPWNEHKSHSGKCAFLAYSDPNKPKKMTIEDFFALQKTRDIIFLRKESESLLEQMKAYHQEARKQMLSLI